MAPSSRARCTEVIDDGGGTVRVEAGVPGGDGAARGEHRREPGQHGRGQAAARPVVGLTVLPADRPSGPGTPASGTISASNTPAGGRRQGPPVAAQRQRVLPLPADAEVGGHVFGGHAHVRIAEA